MKRNNVRFYTMLIIGGLVTFSVVSNANPKRAKIENRIQNQEKRIDEGVKNGQLSPEQETQLRADEEAIKNKVAAEKSANGGKLTKEQRKEIKQELKAESKKIREEKHPVPAAVVPVVPAPVPAK